jgi:hypothetical protein
VLYYFDDVITPSSLGFNAGGYVCFLTGGIGLPV